MSGLLWQGLEYLKQGGWVMIPLAIASLGMWALILERYLTFRGLMRNDISLAKAVRIVRGEKTELWSRGLRVQLMQHFLEKRSGDPDLDAKILAECSAELRTGLTRYLAIIAVLASVAPLMGLLGTVLGMIETFEVIALFGTGNARAMAGGISVALVTTQSGLLVAIPGLFLSGMLARRSRQLQTRLDEVTMSLQRIVRQPLRAKGMQA